MPIADASSWFAWAVLSACFAALTAIFAKIGLKGMDSDFATLVWGCSPDSWRMRSLYGVPLRVGNTCTAR